MKQNADHEVDDRTAQAIHALAEEMGEIKRLLVLLLMKGGASQTEVARALEVNKSTVCRQFKLGDVKPFVTRTQDGQDEE